MFSTNLRLIFVYNDDILYMSTDQRRDISNNSYDVHADTEIHY